MSSSYSLRCFFKFSLITTFLIGLLGNSFADGEVIPRTGRIMLGGSYNYFKPISSNLDYAVVQTNPFSPTNTIAQNYTIKTRFQSNFDLFIGYWLSDLRNFVKIDWQYFNDTSLSSANTSMDTLTPPFETGALPGERYARGKVHFELNRIDFMYGHLFNYAAPFFFTPSAGIRYLNLKEKFNNFYSDLDSDMFTVNPRSSFEGAGPRLALNIAYLFTPYLSLVAEGGGSVIIGAASTSDLHVQSDNVVLFQIKENNITQASPEIDGRIGLRYFHDVPNYPDWPFMAEVGFHAVSYIHALNSLTPLFDATSLLLSTTRVQSSFTLMGPYVKVGFNL